TGPGSSPGVRADELCPGRGVPVRPAPRDDHASGAAADGQGGAHEAVAQPHAVRARLLPRDPGSTYTSTVFDAHDKAFRFYGGVCRRGIYDNMKTAVEAIFVGKARRYNLRFLQMCSH